MNNLVEVSPEFKRDLKPLLKKYHTLRSSIEELQSALIINPFLGISYRNGIYKARLADKSKAKRKSGGFRVLYYHLQKTDDKIIILLTSIYNKSETGTISKKQAMEYLDDIVAEYKAKKNG